MDTSSALKLITAGAMLAFMMPYITMITLAILLWIDARKSAYAGYFEKSTDYMLTMLPEKVRLLFESFITLPKNTLQTRQEDDQIERVPFYHVGS
jgi:hypothetical protein